MCGDSHLPPAPESSDLIAIIHPSASQESFTELAPLSRTSSHTSTTSTTSSISSISSSGTSIRGRLRFSNQRSGNTISRFSHDDGRSASPRGTLNVRIHKYGSPLQFGNGNPVTHEFCMALGQDDGFSSGVRLDFGVGGDGVIGRTVSIVDGYERVLGEGIIGRT